MKRESINIKNLQQDEVYVKSEVVSLSAITGYPVRKGLEKVIISEGTIVNTVSDQYGHLPNEKFFFEVEQKLVEGDIQYLTRSINRDNRSFAVDYILNDESFHINVKNGMDKIRPMLRFVNSYDGSCKTAGYFGFFREVCSNGLHVTHADIGFNVKHRGNIVEIVLPEIRGLVNAFMDNQYYSLHRKFEVLAEKKIANIEDFVKYVAGELKLFKYEKSEQNPDPSLNAQLVIDTISGESRQLRTPASLWLGYNAFNEMLHGKLKKTFEQQRNIDTKLFELVSDMAN